MKIKRKAISIFVTISFLMTLLVPIAPALALSDNHVSRIVTIDDEWNGYTGVDLVISEDTDYTDDFVDGDVFQLVLPTGVNWNDAAATSITGTATAVVVSDQIMEVTISGATNGVKDKITVKLDVEIDGADGDITVTIDPMDSAVSKGSYVFARVAGDNSTARALSVETIGDSGGYAGDIRIEEASVGSLGNGYQYIKLELPNDFKWKGFDETNDISFSGGFSGLTLNDGATTNVKDGDYDVYIDGSDMYIYFDPKSRTQRGLITVKTPIDPDKDADYGEVEVSISGSEVDDHDVVVAEYVDFGVEVSVDKIEDIKAGKFGEELDTITIEETVPGTLIANRDITLVFPSWVLITDASVKASGGGLKATAETPDGTDSELDIRIDSASSNKTGKIEIDLEISVQGDKSGDIELTVEGKRAGMGEDVTLVVGKAVALVEASVESVKDVKIGVQSQEIGDITITELVKEAISNDPNGPISKGEITLTLPEGVKFAHKPKVEVVEGNLDIDEDNISLATDGSTNDNRVVIPVKDSSSKASKIVVSDIDVTVDRTVPTGDLVLKVGGIGIIENQKANEGWLKGKTAGGKSTEVDEGEFDVSTAVKVKIANIITPAPGEVTGTAVFTIGESKYTLNGQEVTMDVAPYIKGDRTYLPVRFVAQALGVAEDNIMWNQAEQSVVLIKGDRIAKLTIGSNTMLVNGVAFTMDVAPELVDPGRTMLPIRWVAQALGASVAWDAATQTVTITQ